MSFHKGLLFAFRRRPHSLLWPLQIQKMGLVTKDIKSFSALTELVAAAKDQATAEQS